MKNLLIFLIILFICPISAQIITFTDIDFKNTLLNTLCVDTDNNGNGDADADFNNDGEIDVAESLIIKNFYFSSLKISDFNEFKYFTNLERLLLLSPQSTEITLPTLPKLNDHPLSRWIL